MSIFPAYYNTVSATIEKGENLNLDLILLDDQGKRIPYQVPNPDEPTEFFTLILNWKLRAVQGGNWLTYSIGNGIVVVNGPNAQYRLEIPMGILNDPIGYKYFLTGRYDNKPSTTESVLAKGVVQIRNGAESPINAAMSA